MRMVKFLGLRFPWKTREGQAEGSLQLSGEKWG